MEQQLKVPQEKIQAAFGLWMSTGTNMGELAKELGLSECTISKKFTRILNQQRNRKRIKEQFEYA
jgi:hypothetical protein